MSTHRIIRSRARWGVVLVAALLVGVLAPSMSGAGATDRAASGTITGTVTDPGGDPIEGAMVTSWYWDYESTYTGADGTYELTVSPGNLPVQFFPPEGSDLAPEYYDDTYGTPTPVHVVSGAESAGIDAQLEVGGTITGTVTDSVGSPLAGSFVSAATWWNDSGWFSTTTDALGAYELVGLPPEHVAVSADPPGNRPDLLYEYYDGAYSFSQANLVRADLGSTLAGIDLALDEGGVITGTVTDDAGDPMPDVWVSADTGVDGDFYWEVPTEADGSYELGPLPPGDYRITFDPYDHPGYMREYFDNSFNPLEFDPVPVTSGDVTTDIDAELGRASTISGRVTGLDGRGTGGVHVFVYDGVGTEVDTFTNGTGGWSARVPGGDYDVRFEAPYAEQWFDGSLTAAGATTVTVPPGGGLAGIDGMLDRILFGQTDFGGNATLVSAQCTTSDPATFAFEVEVFDTGDGTSAGTIDFGDGSPVFAFSASGASVSHTYTWGGGSSTGPAFPVTVTTTGGPGHTDTYTITPGATPCSDGGLPTFTDVPADHPFFGEIECLVDLGITTGFDDGTFRPSALITRQAVVAWLWRLAGEPDPGALPQFSDVPEGHPFEDAIAWASIAGIANGFPDGTFRPGDEVTRQAVAAWVWRYAGEPPPGGPPPFSDVAPDHPFAEPIAWVAEAGIAGGFSDGTFRPAQDITRQAVAAWICRLSSVPPWWEE
jgi:hypothetical protein